ncbi:nucleotide sugar dehydrogenase [Dictyobacter arantiisoli]|uniref:Nucleotide sugar dehydrogenase n=1 Tax=Dictyobacter arantiisoli TaxID=2014874 RepID=A0A5A5TET2_9CHLR|nr:nucleotide sugar dehydrogenase [Dictyobacter arantiisoli]GCF10070.1 nucleotide sugar dehydrogenase [Dictyobacter arantiisoli]
MQINTTSFVSAPLTIAVVGLGKIGLPLAVQYARHGQRVIGCDINQEVVDNLNAGRSHIQEESELATDVPRLIRAGFFSATTSTQAAVCEAQVVVVIVPVAIDAEHVVNTAHIDAASRAIGDALQPGTLVIYETTLPVGTTSRHLRQLLEQTSQLQAGKDFYLAYSPERVSSGSVFHDLRMYPKVVGGIDAASTERAITFYRSVLDAEIIAMASTDEAEFVKLIETTYRDVNIALANEYACYADMHQLNVHAAIAAANTQPYSHIHTPGVGVGGHCIPVYPYFLFSNPLDHAQPGLADTAHTMLTLPRQARQINDGMAEYTIQRLEEVVGPLYQQSVLLLGVAYRGDVRETAFTSARLLQAALRYRDAIVYADDVFFNEDELKELGYTALPAGYEDRITAVILQCDHRAYHHFNFSPFSRCQVVLDGRHALRRAEIEAAGMHYLSIGDGTTLAVKNDNAQRLAKKTVS